MSNLKLITTHKDYLLLVDEINKKSGFCINKNLDTIYMIDHLVGGVYNWLPIIAHLPLNNAPVLEGVPLLPELPKQNTEVFEWDFEIPNKEGEYFVRTNLADKMVCNWEDKKWEGDLRGDRETPETVLQFLKPSQRRWTDGDIEKVIDEISNSLPELKRLATSQADDYANVRDVVSTKIWNTLSPVKLPIGFEPEMENVYDIDKKGNTTTDSTQAPHGATFIKRPVIINNVIQGRYIYE